MIHPVRGGARLHRTLQSTILSVQCSLSLKDTEQRVQSQPHRAVYISTSELGTPLYTGQPAGSQWCPLLTGSTVYTHLPSTSTHPLSPALCPQVKLRLRLLVIQPLLDVHQWTSAVVHFVHHIGLGLTDTHNLSHKHNLRCVVRRGFVQE